jgi:hypothetical protein
LGFLLPLWLVLQWQQVLSAPQLLLWLRFYFVVLAQELQSLWLLLALVLE